MPSKSGVFISYARRDGEAFANAFRTRLAESAPELRVWQDRPEIEGGVGWWRQIEQALECVEVLVIVMTPAALASEVTRREWRAARQNGVAVYPVKGPGFDPGAANVPRWMARVHCYDLQVQWESFVAHLRRGPQPARVPFMAPPLPTDFVSRPDELEALKRLLLTREHRDAVAITTALAGAGGFGKTTLAAALSHDDDVVTAFDDGVLWATLGQTPNVQGELTRLYAALTGERPSFISVEDAAQALAEKLANRTCLIVVDDVWDPAHLRPFCRGGPSCARLVTTRQAPVASEAARVDVDEMKPEEAVSLLVARLPEGPTALEPFRRLAHRLGEWPLLLKLAAGAMRQRIERGDSIAGALVYVGKALDRRGITAFDRASDADRRGAVAATIDLGLEQLSPSDRERCIELAIFPEDVDVPIAVVGELWGLDPFDTEDTLGRLDNASLLAFDLKLGMVSMHDVMRAYLAMRLSDGGRAAHASLLRAWGDLHRLPHAYAWRWVLHHMEGAGRKAEIDALLGDASWLAAKLRVSGIYAMLDDFRWASPNPTLDRLGKVLRLASHALVRDPSQIVPQLLARLPDIPPSFRASLEGVAVGAGHVWLRPTVASLSGPGGALLRTLVAPGPVVDLALSPAGDRIYAGVEGGRLVLWDAGSGTQVDGPAPEGERELPGLSSAAMGTVVAPLSDGRLIIGGPHGFAVWEHAAAPAPVRIVEVPEGVFSMAASPSGERLLIGTKKGTLGVWDVGTGEQVLALRGHRLAIASVAITPDGSIGLSGGYDKAAHLWNLETGELVDTLYALNEGVVYAVALSADGKLGLTGAADGVVRLWELPAGRLRGTLVGHTHRVYAVTLSADGRYALSGSHDRTVKAWDLLSGDLLRTLQGHADAVNAVAFMPDGRYVVSGGRDASVRVWQLDAGEVRAPTQQHDGWIHAVALAPDGSLAVTAGQDHMLRVWDPACGRVTRELKGHHDVVSTVALDTALGRIVSGSHDHTLRVWHLASDAVEELRGPGDAINVLALTATGTFALSGSLDGAAFLWNLEHMRIERRWDAHRRAITFVAVTRRGRVAVTGSIDGTLSVWDLARLKCFKSLPAHSGGITAGAISPEARHLLSGGSDGTIRLWTFPACEVLKTIDAHAERVRSLQILPKAGLFISAGYDRYVKVWRFPEMTPVASFATDSAVAAVAGSDDGRLFVAGDAQGCAHFLGLEGHSSGASDVRNGQCL